MTAQGPSPGGSTSGDGGVLPALLADLARLGDEAELSANTLAAYRRDLRVWAEHLDALGVSAVADVEAGHVAALADLLEGGRNADGRAVSPATATRRLATVRRLHRARVAWGIDHEDPTLVLRDRDIAATRIGGEAPGSAPEGEDDGAVEPVGRAAAGSADGPVQVPDGEALDELVAAIPAGPRADHGDARDRALLAVLVDAGPRISELVAIDVDDVRDGGHTVVVAGRRLPLGVVARRALATWRDDVRPLVAADGELALLTNLRGRRLSRQGAWLAVRRRAEAAGLDVTPRTLRAAFVARLVDEGHDDDEVRRRTGDRTDHAQRPWR